MPDRISFGNMQVNLSVAGSKVHGQPEPETPFRILILGDFTGRVNRGIGEPFTAARRPMMVDIDNFDQLCSKLAPRLDLPLPGVPAAGLPISFASLEDFHPDPIYEHLDLFQALRKTRKDLLNPATFAQAAAEVQSWAPSPGSPGSSPAPGSPGSVVGSSSSQPQSPSEPQGDMFSRLLGKPASKPYDPARAQAAFTLDAMLKQIVGPHIVASPDPRQDQLVAAVDSATTAQMRTILHDPAFQALESAWRALDFLVRNLETDELLKLYIVDISQEELAADLTATDNLRSTGLYNLLVEQTINTPGGQPWAAVMGNFTFDATAADAQLLGRIAKICREARIPFLAAAHPHVLGCESLVHTPNPKDWTTPIDPQAQAAWQALRELHEAAYLGLALPRFLLRLPYGRDTESTDRFNFEEIDSDQFGQPVQRSLYLWGNPAFISILLIGQAFTDQGWDLNPSAGSTIDGLPAHTYQDDGESHMIPCAETWLTDAACDAILTKGLMPLLSIKHRDAVRLARIQSIASPPKALAGRWA